MAVGCKAYTAYNAITGEEKKGTKGIPHSVPVDVRQFLKCLYHGDKHRIRLQTLQKDSSHQMTRMSREKVGLTDIYIKHFVADDQITCTPLRVNGRLL